MHTSAYLDSHKESFSHKVWGDFLIVPQLGPIGANVDQTLHQEMFHFKNTNNHISVGGLWEVIQERTRAYLDVVGGQRA